MANHKQFLARLLNAIRGSNAPEDVDAFKDLFHRFENDREPERIDSLTSTERNALGDKLLRQIDNAIVKAERQDSKHNSTRRRMIHAPWMRVAASVLLLVTSAGILQFLFPEWGERLTRVERTILPGARGEVTLSDGTVVSMNGGSTITYSRWFFGKTRKVTLTGEAFFKVKRDEDKPFVVQTGDVETVVLGTSFNVKAYAGLDNTTVSVASGKVRISREGEPLSLLTANQEIIVNASGKYTIDTNVDMHARVAWREGRLVFDNYTMREVATLLSNYYKVEVVFMDSTLKNTSITGKFDAGTSLDNVLKAMSYVKHFRYTIEDRKVSLRSGRAGNR